MPVEPLELRSNLSGSDAVSLLEVIHKSRFCEKEEDFVSLFPKIQELLSCEYAVACLGYGDARKGAVIVDGVNISFPEGWHTEYKTNNYERWDPVVNENFRNYKSQWWSDTKKGNTYTETQKKIVSLCLDFNMKEGFTVGKGPSRLGKTGSMFCFSGSTMKKDERSEVVSELLVPHLHAALSRVSEKRAPCGKKINLSGREREVLEWLKQGKSSWDISTILGISESTANYHVYNIMRKLQAVNRPQAVAAALRLGLIGAG